MPRRTRKRPAADASAAAAAAADDEADSAAVAATVAQAAEETEEAIEEAKDSLEAAASVAAEVAGTGASAPAAAAASPPARRSLGFGRGAAQMSPYLYKQPKTNLFCKLGMSDALSTANRHKVGGRDNFILFCDLDVGRSEFYFFGPGRWPVQEMFGSLRESDHGKLMVFGGRGEWLLGEKSFDALSDRSGHNVYGEAFTNVWKPTVAKNIMAWALECAAGGAVLLCHAKKEAAINHLWEVGSGGTTESFTVDDAPPGAAEDFDVVIMDLGPPKDSLFTSVLECQSEQVCVLRHPPTQLSPPDPPTRSHATACTHRARRLAKEHAKLQIWRHAMMRTLSNVVKNPDTPPIEACLAAVLGQFDKRAKQQQRAHPAEYKAFVTYPGDRVAYGFKPSTSFTAIEGAAAAAAAPSPAAAAAAAVPGFVMPVLES